MAHRRSLIAIVLLAACLHTIGIARTLLPAQDGLKLIRFARQFQNDPWADVVRGADVHPLYPALVAIVEPVVAQAIGESADTWRIAAQLVAVLASLGLLIPVYFLTEAIFDRRIAFIAAGVLALLPRAAEVGRETLGDGLGLVATFMALWLAARALRSGDWRFAAGAGAASGLGYLARPEAILLPAVIGLAWLVDRMRPSIPARPRATLALSLMLLIPALSIGGYATIKGGISEKVSLRTAAGLGPQAMLVRSVPQPVPRGLDDPRWDFSPKEETDNIAIRGLGQALKRILGRWWEELAWFFAVMTVWGVARRRAVRQAIACDETTGKPRIESRLLGLFALVYLAALLRHSTTLGYLSWRHVLPLVVASMPWAAAGTYLCCRRIGELMRLSSRPARFARYAATAFTLGLSIAVQMNPSHWNHLSRWGHWSAGRWLAAHAAPGEKVLDTRGWAQFVSRLPGYDYWHVRQALTDSALAYVLVGVDELQAASARGATLRAILSFAGTPLANFPASPDDPTPAVVIYRFHRPVSWEGMAR